MSLDLPPYALALGIGIAADTAANPVLWFDYSERIAGRPGSLHGGAISGLMEMAAVAALRGAWRWSTHRAGRTIRRGRSRWRS